MGRKEESFTLIVFCIWETCFGSIEANHVTVFPLRNIFEIILLGVNWSYRSAWCKNKNTNGAEVTTGLNLIYFLLCSRIPIPVYTLALKQYNEHANGVNMNIWVMTWECCMINGMALSLGYLVILRKPRQNETSIQWTPGSQIYCSNQKIIFSKKWFWKKIIKNH